MTDIVINLCRNPCVSGRLLIGEFCLRLISTTTMKSGRVDDLNVFASTVFFAPSTPRSSAIFTQRDNYQYLSVGELMSLWTDFRRTYVTEVNAAARGQLALPDEAEILDILKHSYDAQLSVESKVIPPREAGAIVLFANREVRVICERLGFVGITSDSQKLTPSTTDNTMSVTMTGMAAVKDVFTTAGFEKHGTIRGQCGTKILLVVHRKRGDEKMRLMAGMEGVEIRVILTQMHTGELVARLAGDLGPDHRFDEIGILKMGTTVTQTLVRLGDGRWTFFSLNNFMDLPKVTKRRGSVGSFSTAPVHKFMAEGKSGGWTFASKRI